MKNLFVTTLFAFFVMVTFGQEISKNIQWRLNPILKSVEVNEDEKKALIVAIEKFQKNEMEFRTANDPSKQEDRKLNGKQYLSEVKRILGNERFNKWRQDTRKKNKS